MLQGRRIRRINQIRRAIVARLRMLRLHRVDELAGLLRAIRPGQRRNKARTLNLDLVGQERTCGERAKNGHEPSLGELAPLGL